MIPKFSFGMAAKNQSKTVFINPEKIPTTHINPNFLLRFPQPHLAPASSIHVNPAFLSSHSGEYTSNLHSVQKMDAISELGAVPPPSQPPQKPQNKLIIKSRTKLIREPFKQPPKAANASEPIQPKLIKIGSKKLVRSTLNTKFSVKSPSKNKFSKYKFVRKEDNFSAIRNKLVRYPSKKIIRYQNNMHLQFHNNNRVIYKSSKTKYERVPSKPFNPINQLSSAVIVSNKPRETVVCVRGNKFILDKQGLSLKRVMGNEKVGGSKLKRIDIGGVTYVENNNSNLLVRTETHRARTHLNLAKHKSISFLSSLHNKSDLPCLIYQKLGKCSAFEVGRCTKIHDKNRIAICKRFLRGECLTNENCLLSHNVSMTKMPVCKFYLQGLCVRDDCLYLHKKLNKKVDICLNFLNGFCQEAEKCTRRHEFACPNLKKNGEKCEDLLCIFCRPKSALNTNRSPKCKSPEVVKVAKNLTVSRYFVDQSRCDAMMSQSSKDSADSQNVKPKVKPSIGDLPSFIPF